MDAILRSAAVYLALLVIFRLAGRRPLSETTTFDLLLLLIISEAIQGVLVGDDYSFTQALLIVLTLVSLDVVLSWLKQRVPVVSRVVEGLPLVIVQNGEPLKDRMDRMKVGEDDVLQAARQRHGLERMEQIKYAVLERSGGISIIPQKS
jgi:uncharacterized membrane protein YcaP (DUF421 family)